MNDTVEAWHWIAQDRMTRYAPRVPIVVGETLRVEPPLALCERGLHASLRALDALQYAPGTIVCRVRMSGDIVRGNDKLVATERTVLWMYDATRVLHEFACCVAEAALLLAEVGDARCWQAIEAKRAWLRGEIDDMQLAAAWDAAWAAASSAARDAAIAAAWSAAWAAAREAAREAAWAAASSAASSAAWAAPWSAAREAAWAAAWDEQSTLLEQMLTEARP